MNDETKMTFIEWVKAVPIALTYEERMIKSMKKLLEEGCTNPSSITSKLWYLGFKEGRFVEIRKIAEFQYKLHCQEESKRHKH
jgi:hypothetical protein